MLKTLQEKQKYIQQNRLRNYEASLALEGISTVNASGCIYVEKSKLKEKYQKLASVSSR
jgi:hypothetical protein